MSIDNIRHTTSLNCLLTPIPSIIIMDYRLAPIQAEELPCKLDNDLNQCTQPTSIPSSDGESEGTPPHAVATPRHQALNPPAAPTKSLSSGGNVRFGTSSAARSLIPVFNSFAPAAMRASQLGGLYTVRPKIRSAATNTTTNTTATTTSSGADSQNISNKNNNSSKRKSLIKSSSFSFPSLKRFRSETTGWMANNN